MVLHESSAKYGRLLREVWVELHPAELRCWSVQRGFGEMELGGFRQDLCLRAEHCLGDKQVVAEVNVADRHGELAHASRSRISRFSFTSRCSRSLNSTSLRRASICAATARRTASATEMPSTRATVSRSAA